MNGHDDSSDQQRLTRLVNEIETLRLKRRRASQRSPDGKRFSQDELRSSTYASYKNMLLGRTHRLPDREALLQIADYLECTPAERNALLRTAQYEPEQLPDSQWRKQATLLLGNASVPLDPTLDVEDAAGFLSTLWQRLEEVIVTHRGTIAERTGNGLLALWSIETTYEDDPEQAVRAALAMHGVLQSYGAKSRIGIHTGLAFIQSANRTGQIHVTGEVVNIASQLMHLAPPNTVLISHSTYSQLSRVIDAQPVTSISLGTGLLAVYAVERFKPITVPIILHGSREVESPMIGRDSELTVLQDALAAATATRQQRIIVISGEAGIGKSRLLHEFNGWLANSPIPVSVLSFHGRAVQSSQEMPYSLLRSMLSYRFQIMDEDFSETLEHKIENGLADIFPDVDTAHKAAYVISHLLSFSSNDSPYIRNLSSDAQEFFEVALNYLHIYFEAILERHAVIFILEDTHWADDSSLIMLGRLNVLLLNHPILIIYTARSGLPDPPWVRLPVPSTQLDLHPLSIQDSYRLLGELLPRADAVPDTLRDLIVNASNGNPLYIEELVKMLVENGTLLRDTGLWALNHVQLAAVQVPTTLTALLQARFDNLSPSQQRLLQLASVFGRVFWDGGIKYLDSSVPTANSTVHSALSATIDQLGSQKMVFRHKKSTFRGYTEYTFKHALMCDVIHETILKQDRLAYHAAAARWLVSIAAKNQRLDEFAGLIAYHFKCAQIAVEAAQWYRRAGNVAAARFANTEALTYFTCALDLLPSMQKAERYAILTIRERVHDALGLREAQSQDLDTLFELAQSMNDTQHQVEVLVRQANYAYLLGNKAEVARLSRTAIDLAQLVGAHEYQASCYVMLGNALWDQGNHEQAQACYDNALQLSEIIRRKAGI